MDMKHGFRSLPEAERALPSVHTAQVPDGPVEYISAGSRSPTIVLVNGLRVQLGTWALPRARHDQLGLRFRPARRGRQCEAWGAADRGGDRRSVACRARRGRTATALCSGENLDWRVYVNLYAQRFPQGGGRDCPTRVEPPR